MKNLEYFMTLPYRIEIRPIPENKGGGYEASIPELGRYAVRADGDTIEEALNGLESIRKERLAAYLEEGLSIPEPAPDEEDYSGKFVLRIPKNLHRELSHRARLNNVSLNQFTTAVLSSGLAIERFYGAIQSLEHEVKDLQQRVHALRYTMQGNVRRSRSTRYGIDEAPKAA